MPESSTFDVVICGGGIGGLAAAASLRAFGIHTTVLEQAPVLGEIGAGVQIGPNAAKVLYRLGLGQEAMRISHVVQETINRRWDSGRVIAKTVLGPSAIATYGAPYLQVHRADLHSVLLEAAVGPGVGPAATIVTGGRVVDVDTSDPLRPAAITADGGRHAADVVVGADGVRSVVRRHVGAPDDVRDSGDMAYRLLVDGDAVRADPTTRFLVDWQAGNVWFGSGRHVVVYPVRDFSLVNVVGIAPITEEVSRDWSRTAIRDELVAAYAGWDERLLSLMSKAEPEVMLWALKIQDPYAGWSRGRLTLLGDACHAMVPYVSQGASQAIEDGYVLAEELALAARTGAVEQALVSYADRRSDRAATVQRAALANRVDFHLPDGEQQLARDARLGGDHRLVNTSLDFIYAGTPLKEELVPAV